MRFNTCLTSDGAAAAVLRRGHPRIRWLASELTTDPRCVDFFRVEYGGAAAPFPPVGTGNRDVDPIELVYEHFRRDPEHLAEFRLALTTRLASVVHRACGRAGVAVSDLARLVYINDNQPSLQAVADAVGVPIERTNADLAAAVGHCGAADHLISLDRYLGAGELREGDVVALAGLSSGMHWFCTILEV
jgi:3-oxoacyl-[acyl-carrier-protein] synthase-3